MNQASRQLRQYQPHSKQAHGSCPCRWSVRTVNKGTPSGNDCVEKLGELEAGQRQTAERNSISSSILHGEARNSFLRNDGIAMLLIMA
jgi:hypothetical protein